MITPNKNELSAVFGRKFNNKNEILKLGKEILVKYNLKYLLVTLSEEGMILFKSKGQSQFLTTAKEVYDVSGAGDTVIAFVALGLSVNLSIEKCIKLANIAAGIVVGKSGTAVLHQRYQKMNIDDHLVIERVNNARENNLIIGFTNGCYDLLHEGHLHLIQKASTYCDFLIVAINSDKSVREIKGSERPIENQYTRLNNLKKNKNVDEVIVFDELTPINLIKKIIPDVLIKGSDYRKEDIVGYDVVKSAGGKVITIDLLDGYSTTNIINQRKIK